MNEYNFLFVRVPFDFAIALGSTLFHFFCNIVCVRYCSIFVCVSRTIENMPSVAVRQCAKSRTILKRFKNNGIFTKLVQSVAYLSRSHSWFLPIIRLLPFIHL